MRKMAVSSLVLSIAALVTCIAVMASTGRLVADDLPPPRRPNIVLVTADDLGLQLGCYGDTIAHTKHLDRFARDGARFSRAFVTQASCSSSRSSMLTGLYPHQNGQIGLAHLGYSLSDTTLATLPGELKKAGYTTGIIGKLHVGPENSFPFDFRNLDSKIGRDVDKVAALAKQFIEETGDNPFFLMVNFTDPHRPLMRDVNGRPRVKVDADDVEPFAFLSAHDRGTNQSVADYYCCVNRVDEGFGLLMEIFKQHGLSDDMLIVVIGDHGPPFPRAKAACTEAGLQVPMLVRWPESCQRGFISDALISIVDLMPTFLDAADVDIPAGLAGRSLLPIMSGKKPAVRKYIFGEFTAHTPRQFSPARTVRDERYKLHVHLLLEPVALARLKSEGIDPVRQFPVCRSEMAAVELYDLKNDPHEFRNLADDPNYSAIRKELEVRLRAWREETEDPLLDLDCLVDLSRSHVGITEKYVGPNAGETHP